MINIKKSKEEKTLMHSRWKVFYSRKIETKGLETLLKSSDLQWKHK